MAMVVIDKRRENRFNPKPTMSSSPSSAAHILYMDDQNHLVPLLNCYHSTASRSLCSSTTASLPTRYPVTTLSYVDSYYCSNCFQYYDTIQGINKPLSGVCSKCYMCPFCCSNVMIHCVPTPSATSESQHGDSVQSFDCYYKCHNCDYTSKQHCAPQLMVKLLLIVPSKSSTTKDNKILIENATAPTNTFKHWNALQSAAKDLLATMIRRQYYTSKTTVSHFHHQYTLLVDRWKAYFEIQQRKRNFSRMNRRPVMPAESTDNRNNNKAIAKWSMSELEAKLRSINDDTTQSVIPADKVASNESCGFDHDLLQNNSGYIRRKSIHDILMQQKQQGICADDETTNEIKKQYDEWKNISMISYLTQSVLFDENCSNKNVNETSTTQHITSFSVMSYYPIPRPFQIRYSIRSKKDVLIHHRPGIVLKTKLNPLDGDSSTSHSSAVIGQWYRKDSSAIYTIPHVQVTRKYGYDGATTNAATHGITTPTTHFFLLQVTNPTLGPIRFRLLLSQSTASDISKYSDDFSHWNDNESDVDVNTTTATFRNVLLDPLHRSTTEELRVLLFGSNLSASTETPTIELQSMEDSILLDYASTSPTAHGISSNTRNVLPDAINDLGLDHHSNYNVDRSYNRLRFVAQNASTAWYELSVVEPMIQHHPNTSATSSYGIPMILEIDLGNGSWESSLIPVEKENDTVRLDLVLVFRTQGF